MSMAAERSLSESLSPEERINNTLDTYDYVCIGIYCFAVLCVGIGSSFTNRGSVGGYYLAGQKMSWWLVGTSLFASNIGSSHFMGLAGDAAKDGIGISIYELHAVYFLLLLGWIFLPVYKSAGVYTLPEYLSKRFGGKRIRSTVAVLSLVLYVFTKISSEMFAGGLFLSHFLPQMDFYLSVSIVVMIAAFFTITGGLSTVMWTDAIQTLIMLLGGFVLMIITFDTVGGFEELQKKFSLAIPDTLIENQNNESYPYQHCGRPSEYFFKLIRPHNSDDLPWTGVIFGSSVSALWYWCADQVIVQRVLASNNMVEGKVACLMAAYMKLLPMWLIVFPGMAARVLFTNTIACNEPEKCRKICGRSNGCHLEAYPHLVLQTLPSGTRGLLFSTLLAALVTSLTSVFHSTATIFTLDLWGRFRRRASIPELMVMGRLCIVLLIAICIMWLPVVREVDILFEYIQRITSCLAPPLAAIFLVSVFWERTTESAVFWGLILGILIGISRFIWDEVYPATPCGVPGRNPSLFLMDLHYLHFGAMMFTIVLIFVILASFLDPPPPESLYLGITFFTRFILPEFKDEVEEDASREEITDFQNQQGEQSPTRTCGCVDYITGGKSYGEQPWYWKICLWLCGVEAIVQPEKSSNLMKITSTIFEPELASHILHANAAMVVIIVTIIWGLYG